MGFNSGFKGLICLSAVQNKLRVQLIAERVLVSPEGFSFHTSIPIESRYFITSSGSYGSKWNLRQIALMEFRVPFISDLGVGRSSSQSSLYFLGNITSKR